MSLALDLLFAFVIIFLMLVFINVEFGGISNAISTIEHALGAGSGVPMPNASNNITTVDINPTKINQSQLANYTLGLINQDRAQYGLAPVTLSIESSAQQHSEAMLYYGYFSHWDTFGLKPYMRYTLFGGTGAVDENVAYETSESCGLLGCTGNINPESALQTMEYNMMYNDSVCCNNGHRDNILNPEHNQVSIGVAYNASTIYLTEDFIDNYITWKDNTPTYGSNGEMYLDGQLASGYSVFQVSITYDPPLQNLTTQTVPSGPYGYGTQIAGVVPSSLYYYKNITTIVADTYTTSGSSFDIEFNMRNLISKYGAGEYTEMLTLNDTSTGSSFLGSTYTIFINQSGDQYVPKDV